MLQVTPISDDDYFTRNPEFSTWLRERRKVRAHGFVTMQSPAGSNSHTPRRLLLSAFLQNQRRCRQGSCLWYGFAEPCIM